MAEKNVLYREVTKWAAIAVAITFTGLITAISQSNTYSKAEVDRQVDQVVEHHNRDIDRIYQMQEQAQESLDWLVRKEGGEPIRRSEEDR